MTDRRVAVDENSDGSGLKALIHLLPYGHKAVRRTTVAILQDLKCEAALIVC